MGLRVEGQDTAHGAYIAGGNGAALLDQMPPSLRAQAEASGMSADEFTRTLEPVGRDYTGPKVPPRGPDPDLDEFLAQPEPEYDWVIPGLVERGDRIILTGPEGGGKSTLLRQIAVQVGAGFHPFTHGPMDPVRVLLVDLENSRRHLRRQLRPLRDLASTGLAAGHVTPISHPEGLDLLTQADRDWLTERIRANEPELLVVGPIYKLAGGNPSDEEPARAVAAYLDQQRAAGGFAVMLEAHTPHATQGGARPKRPFGASLWMRWPEFGLHLAPTGELTHWRGARDERSWPAALTRTDSWPWAVPTNPTDVLWARIVDHTEGCLTRPSIRDLATALDVPKSTVERAIKHHRQEWDAMEGMIP